MQINAIYTRSMVQTLTEKAIRDLRSGGAREVRNVIELFKGISVLPGSRDFWNHIGNILRTPNQQYSALLSRIANDADSNCLKTLIANLGFYPDSTAAQDRARASPYWLEPLCDTMDAESLCQRVCTLHQQGTRVFLLRIEQEAELDTVLKVAGAYRQCIFLLIYQAVSCDAGHLENMIALGNVVPFIAYQQLASLSDRLQPSGIPFGFYRKYADIDNLYAEQKVLQSCIRSGCFLGIYEGEQQNVASTQARELFYYAKLQTARRRGAQEILLSDLWRDREAIQRLRVAASH